MEKQVFSMPLSELKTALGRKRLRVDRQKIVAYLMALIEQHLSMRHFKAVYDGKRERLGVGYAGFMHGCGLVASLGVMLERKFKQEHQIGFDDLTIVDSSLLPAKEEKSITPLDWKRGKATLRAKPEGGSMRICGEKLLGVINSKKQLVYSGLMKSINDPDDCVLKHPMSWNSRGLKKGVILMDRGFGNKSVRSGFEFLQATLPGFCVKPIFPPRKRQKWTLSEQERKIYKKRWQIEEVFRQLKDPLGGFRLILKGIRRPALIKARVALATLAWNSQHV